MAEEVDVIGHLLDVEHEASGMLLDAQREADKRTADARAKADLEFKTKYKKITDALDSEENSAKERINKSHEDSMAEYRASLDAVQKDTPSFDRMLETVLFNR